MAIRPACPIRSKRDAVADEERLNEALHELTEFAESVGSLLLLEPLNRYETHLIHRLDQGVEWCERIGSERMRLLGDLFHMNIEERDPVARTPYRAAISRLCPSRGQHAA